MLLYESAIECKDHELSISLPENFLLGNPVYLKVVVRSEFSELGSAQIDLRECELAGEWVNATLSYNPHVLADTTKHETLANFEKRS